MKAGPCDLAQEEPRSHEVKIVFHIAWTHWTNECLVEWRLSASRLALQGSIADAAEKVQGPHHRLID